MRESAEAADDVSVLLCEAQVVRVAGGLEQTHAFILIGEVFRVFQRQIEEEPQNRIDQLVVTGGDRGARDFARLGVARKSAR